MNETLHWATAGAESYPLLYTLLANAEFDEHFGGIVADVDDLPGMLYGPHDEQGDTQEDLLRKKKERQRASVFFKRELPWLIATLAKHGIMAAQRAGQTGLPKPPTPQQIAQDAYPGQQQELMHAFNRAYLYGRMTTRQEGETRDVDAGLREYEAKKNRGRSGLSTLRLLGMGMQAGFSEAEAWNTTPARILDLYLWKRDYDDELHRIKRRSGSDFDGD